MPRANTTIVAPLRNALLECFRAITCLVRPEERHPLILVGGAASIAHSSVMKTEDVDVAAPPSHLIQIWEAASAGALGFQIESDGKIAFDAPQGFRVHVDLLEIGSDPIERIHATQPLYTGCVASKSDLLLLRAVTVVERGSDGVKDDFRWLLAEIAGEGEILPSLLAEEREYLRRAAVLCLGTLEKLSLGALLSASDIELALYLIHY